MKILLFSHSCPLREGGIETRSREVAVRLARQGHEVLYLCAMTRESEASEEIYQGVKILRKRVVPDWWLRKFPFPHYFTLAVANVLMMIHLRLLLRKERFDVLREEVAPVPVSGPLAFRKLPFRKRVAIVHMLAGPWRRWIKYYGLVFGSYGYAMERALARGWLKYDEFVTVARWSQRHLQAYDPIRDKVSFIPNGVEMSRFEGGELRASENAGFRLLSVGRLAKTKGHAYLLRALALLNHRGLDVRLTLVGKGALRGSLARLARDLGVAEAVDFVDSVPFDGMPDFMRGFDLFVMPSLHEGFSVVLLEALASGLPVAASDIPAFREILDGKKGELFLPENSEDLADKLGALIQDRERRERLSREGRAHVRAYDWARIAAQEELVFTGGSA